MSKVEMPEPVYAKYRIGNPLWIDREEWGHTGVITMNNYIRHIEKVNNFGKPGDQGHGEEIQVEWLITTSQAEAYAEAKVRESREWIDVKDKTPRMDEWVLAFWTTSDPDYEPGGIETSFYDGRYWQGANGGMDYHGSRRVTHWMPLPSPPTKGEE